MVLAAFRYCLGRQSYIVSCCVDWLIDYWPEIDENTRYIIFDETMRAIEKGDAGDRCDVTEWKRLIANAAGK